MTPALVAIDPGAAHPGPACAYFRDARLVYAEFAYFPVADVDTVVVERMQVDQRTSWRTYQGVLDCQFAGARAAAYVAGWNRLPPERVVTYTPSAWKGTEPKPVQHARLWFALDDAERKVLGGAATFAAIERAVAKGAERRWPAMYNAYPASFKTHNTLDAAALGAFYLGRLEKR